MPRLPRVDVGGEIYHVINRANARLPIFFKEEDFELFEYILKEAQEKFNMRILAYSLKQEKQRKNRKTEQKNRGEKQRKTGEKQNREEQG